MVSADARTRSKLPEVLCSTVARGPQQKNGPRKGGPLIGYGNWSRVGSKHVDDQLALASQKKTRPILRARQDIEKTVESRKVL